MWNLIVFSPQQNKKDSETLGGCGWLTSQLHGVGGWQRWRFPPVLKYVFVQYMQYRYCVSTQINFSSAVCCWVLLLVLVELVVTGRTPLVRRRVWRSQCRAMACQRWVGRLGGGGWLRGAGLAGQGGAPDASSPLSCCVVKQQAQQGGYWVTTCSNTNRT